MDSTPRPSAINIATIREQRKGTMTLPKKKSIVEAVDIIYPANPNRNSDGSYEMAKKASWLEQVRRKSNAPKSKGKLTYEGHFPDNFRGLYSARFNSEGDKFVTSYGAGAMQAWNVTSSEQFSNIRGAPEHGLPIMCVRFIPKTDDNFFAASACGTLFYCAMKAGEFASFVKEPGNAINSVDCNISGETAITAGKDAVIRIYDLQTKTLTGQFCRDPRNASEEVGKHHGMRVFTTKFHPLHTEIFLTGGWDDCVKIWDLRIHDGCVRNIKGPHICGDAVDINDTIILTGSWTVQNSLQLWDMPSGKLIDNIVPINRRSSIDGEFLYCAQYFVGDSSGNTVVIGGSGIANVEAIDLSERKVISSFKVQKSVQAVDSSNKHIIFGGMETTFRLASIHI